jgi:hypothetical protein
MAKFSIGPQGGAEFDTQDRLPAAKPGATVSKPAAAAPSGQQTAETIHTILSQLPEGEGCRTLRNLSPREKDVFLGLGMRGEDEIPVNTAQIIENLWQQMDDLGILPGPIRQQPTKKYLVLATLPSPFKQALVAWLKEQAVYGKAGAEEMEAVRAIEPRTPEVAANLAKLRSNPRARDPEVEGMVARMLNRPGVLPPAEPVASSPLPEEPVTEEPAPQADAPARAASPADIFSGVEAPTTPLTMPPETSDRVDHCPRCHWDRRRKDLIDPAQVTETDKTAFELAWSSLQLFEKTYTYKNALTLTIREISSDETYACRAAISDDFASGRIKLSDHPMALIDQQLRYNLVFQLAKVQNAKGETLYEGPSSVADAQKFLDSLGTARSHWTEAQTLHDMEKFLLRSILTSDSLLRIAYLTLTHFQKLIATMEGMKIDGSFTEAGLNESFV